MLLYLLMDWKDSSRTRVDEKDMDEARILSEEEKVETEQCKWDMLLAR